MKVLNIKLPGYRLLHIRYNPIAFFDVSLLRFRKEWTKKGKLFVYFHLGLGLANTEPSLTKVLKLIFTWDYNRLINETDRFKVIKELVIYRRPLYAKSSKQKNSG